MQITVEVPTSCRVTRSSVSFMDLGVDEDFILRSFELTPIVVDGGCFVVSSHAHNDEGGYSCYEEFYSYRNGSWYKSISNEGRDCDGYTSSLTEYRWDGKGWVKLGPSKCFDQYAESMGY